jgi:hypothetical protein
MIARILNAIALFLRKFFKNDARPQATYSLQIFEDRRVAMIAAGRSSIAAMVCVGDNKKWLFFMCPCGCKQQIALNLMEGHSPRWKIDIQSPASFSVHPSVDATTCGAHFWLRNGMVIWAD